MIEFKKIIIEGFCSIGTLELPLNNNGITIIKGANGLGKTTIFSALVWVLYGKTLKGISDVNLWKKFRTKDYKGTKVEIYFESNNSIHKIIRCQNYTEDVDGAKGGSRLIYLIDAEQVKEKGKLKLQSLIEKNLGMSYNLFINSVMFGQGMKRLIQESGSDKKQLFEEIFELNYISKARKIAQDKYNELRVELDGLMEKLESNQNYIDSILSDLNYTKSKRDNFKSELANKVKSYKDKIILSTKRVDELALKTNKVDINQHNKTIEDIKRKITLYQNKVSGLKKLQKVPLQDLVNEVIELLENKEYTESISKLKTIRDSFSSSESYILRISKLQNKLTNEIESKNSLEKTILTLKYAKEEVKSLESRLKELKSQNPDFESVINKQSKKLENYKKSISQIKSQIQELEKQVNLYKWAYSEPFGNNGIKAFIFESSLSELNNLLSSYSEVLGFNIKFMVDLNSSRKDFVVNINLEGVEVFYEELSGGQKQLVNLAMALAMNQIITQSKGVNIAFLDEVFESLSYDNIEVVIGLIKKVYREKTLFLITHHESLPIPNSKILNVKREHGISAYEF